MRKIGDNKRNYALKQYTVYLFGRSVRVNERVPERSESIQNGKPDDRRAYLYENVIAIFTETNRNQTVD